MVTTKVSRFFATPSVSVGDRKGEAILRRIEHVLVELRDTQARLEDVLLRHAESLGATILEGVSVTGLIHDDHGRVTGVHTDQGETHSARWVIDATGQQGLAGSLADREMDPILQNIAYGTYWKGAQLLEDWNGNLSASRAFIVAHPQGWSWVFPVRKDLVSVGLVTSLEAHRNRKDQDPEALVQQAIAESPHLSRILEGAELCEGPQGSRVRVSTDFSYTSRSIVQPGLIRLGDAAGFVDPILSVGCFLGQSFARFLAYGLNTILSDEGQVDETRALDAYEHQVRDTLASFRELTYFFYRFNQSPDDWWAHARALVASTAMPSAASDREAFLAFATGFAAHGSVWREPGAFFGQDFFVDLYTRFVPAAPTEPSSAPPLHLLDTIVLRAEPTLTASAVPLEGEGRLAPSTRVEVGVGEPGESRRIRRMQVPVAMGELFPLIDGEATLTQIGDTFVAKRDIDPAHRGSLNRYILWIAQSLVDRDLATCITPSADAS